MIVALIIGQPRTGKSTVATKLSEKYSLPIIRTDRLRAELRLHCPWCGFDNEIEPWKEDYFIVELLKLVESIGPCIVEGASIAPRMIGKLSPLSCVMMYRSDTPKDILKTSRKYDSHNCWTYQKADTYLIELFKINQEAANKWKDEFLGVCVDTAQDFHNGIENALKMLEKDIASIVIN